MKQILTVIGLLSLVSVILAQAPQKLNYQAVIRNADNQLVTNHTIGMKISLLQGDPAGTVVFSQTLTPVSNANGLITIEVGDDDPCGEYCTIKWENGPFFIKTEIDPNGGTNYGITASSQLLSVPFALYATKAGNGFSGNYEDMRNKPFLSVSDLGDTLYLSGSNFVIIPGISNANSAPVTDIQGKTYKTVVIGSQVWMAENLMTTRYNNDVGIPIVTSTTNWANQLTEACYETYMGNYYNWYVVESEKICPSDWHVPDDSEWNILMNYLGGETEAGGKMKFSGWCCGNIGATNESGFSALPSGYILWNGDVDQAVGYVSDYWSATEYDATTANSWSLSGGSASLGHSSGVNKRNAYSIRCIKD